MKVTIVGAGNVGATCADAIAYRRIASEIVLLDIREGFAEGKALENIVDCLIKYLIADKYIAMFLVIINPINKPIPPEAISTINLIMFEKLGSKSSIANWIMPALLKLIMPMQSDMMSICFKVMPNSCGILISIMSRRIHSVITTVIAIVKAVPLGANQTNCAISSISIET